MLIFILVAPLRFACLPQILLLFWWHNYGLTGALWALIRMSWYVYYVHFEFTFPLLWNIPNEITFKSHWVSLSPRVWEGVRVLKIGKLPLMNCKILKGPWHRLKSQEYCGSPPKEPRELSFLRKFLVRSLHHRMPVHLEIPEVWKSEDHENHKESDYLQSRSHTPPLATFEGDKATRWETLLIWSWRVQQKTRHIICIFDLPPTQKCAMGFSSG